jgi:hypothetical protein
MYRQLIVVVTALLAIEHTAGAGPLAAQDCGMECRVCGANQWEGTNWGGKLAPYDMDCTHTGESGGCARCSGAVEAANPNWIPADLIAEVVASASAAEVRAVLQAYGDRLLYVPERGAVVVTGTSCSPNGIAVLVMLTPPKVRAFERARTHNHSMVGLLGDFLAVHVAVSPIGAR